MSGAGLAPIAATAIAAKAERKIIETLREAKAYGPSSSHSLEIEGTYSNNRLQRLISKGIVLQVGSGGYYINEQALADYVASQARQWRMIMLAILIVPLLGLASAVVFSN